MERELLSCSASALAWQVFSMDELPKFRAQINHHRQCLKGLVRSPLGPDQRAAVDPSDIVQVTLLEAHQKLHQFRGSSDAELAAWLRKMLVFNIADAFRAAGRQKRDAARE